MSFLYLPSRICVRQNFANAEEFFEGNFKARDPNVSPTGKFGFPVDLEVSIFKVPAGEAARILAEYAASSEKNSPKSGIAWVIKELPPEAQLRQTSGGLSFRYANSHHFELVFTKQSDVKIFSDRLYSWIKNDPNNTVIQISRLEQIQAATQQTRYIWSEWSDKLKKDKIPKEWNKRIKDWLTKLDSQDSYFWSLNVLGPKVNAWRVIITQEYGTLKQWSEWVRRRISSS